MLSIGVDAHKRVHVAIALDDAGRVVDRWRGPNSADGWQSVYHCAAGLGGARQWGIEGAWSHGRGLAQCLVAGGEAVFEINPRWTAAGRRTARNRGTRANGTAPSPDPLCQPTCAPTSAPPPASTTAAMGGSQPVARATTARLPFEMRPSALHVIS